MDKIIKFLERISKAKTWKKVVLSLSSVVVFITVYALILPAITMTNKEYVLECTLAIHQHTDSCKDEAGNYICGKADYVIHTHNETCYDENHQLVCQLPEIRAHEHTEKCYEEVEEEIEVVKIVQHEHNEECYKDDILVCDLIEEEIIEKEIVKVKKLVCELEEDEAIFHIHDEKECYDEDGNLICGLIETLIHNHDGHCIVEKLVEVDDEISNAPSNDMISNEEFEQLDKEPLEEVNVTIQIPVDENNMEDQLHDNINLEENDNINNAEANLVSIQKKFSLKSIFSSEASTLALGDKYDLGQYISSISIQRRANSNELWEDLTNNNVRTGDQLRFDILYELPVGTLDTNHRTITYQVPSNIRITKEESGNVYDSNNAIVGTYQISSSGQITIQFYEDYALKNSNSSKINGHIAFESNVDNITKDKDGNIKLPFKDEIILNVKDPSGDIKVEKTSIIVDPSTGDINYTIEITSVKGTNGPVNITDYSAETQIKSRSVIVKKNNSTIVTGYNGVSALPTSLPKMNAGDKYTITYSAELKSYYKAILNNNDSVKANNEVEVQSVDNENSPIKSYSKVTDPLTKKIIGKTGVPNQNGTVEWTIKLNAFSSTKMDLSGWVLSDQLNGRTLDPNINVKITPNPVTGSGSITTHLPYTFPANSKQVEYSVVYITAGDKESVNQAFLTPPSGGTIGSGEVKPGVLDLVKTAKYNTLIGQNQNGDTIVEQTWNVRLIDDGYTIYPNGTFVKDNYENYTSNNKVFPNGGAWMIREALGIPGKMYFTQSQILNYVENMEREILDAGYTGNYYFIAFSRNGADPWLVKRSANSDQYYNNATIWKNSYKNYTSKSPYTVIDVLFDSPFLPTKTISVDVQSNLIVGDDITQNYGTNWIGIFNATEYIERNVYLPYSPGMIKGDAAYLNNLSTAVNPTEHEYIPDSTTLKWFVVATVPANTTFDSDLVINDHIPDGLAAYLMNSDNSGNQAVSVTFYGPVANGNFSFSNYNDIPLYYTTSRYQPSRNSMKIAATNGSGSITLAGNAITYKLTKHPNLDNGISDIQITIPKNVANNLGGKDIGFIVEAKILDKDFIEKSYVNTVTMNYKGEAIDSAFQKQTVKQKFIKKGTNGIEGQSIPYFISINPQIKDLVSNSDKITLIDQLSYTQPTTGVVNANIDINSIKVYASTSKTTSQKAKEVEASLYEGTYTYDSNISKMNGYVNGGYYSDITSQCPYTITSNVVVGKNVETMNIELPDNRSIIVCYRYKLSGRGVINDFTNRASISGEGSVQSDAENKINITVEKSNASATLVGINIYKVDSNNYAVHLNGAEFKLEKYEQIGNSWRGPTYGWVQQTTYTTQTDGYFNTGELKKDVAYRLTETKAPAGYEMKTPAVYEFYIKGNDTLLKPTGFNGKALNDGDDIFIANDAVPYTLPSTGGIGTMPIKLIGLGLMISSLAILVYRKKK